MKFWSCLLGASLVLTGCQSTQNTATKAVAPPTTETSNFGFRLAKDDPDERIRALYFDVYYALQAYERRQASVRGQLFEFNEQFDKDGKVGFAGVDSITCDPSACVIEARAKSVSTESEEATITKLIRRIGFHTARETSGTFVLGESNGPHISCEDNGPSKSCTFELFRRETAAVDDASPTSIGTPGPENCSQYDQTVRQAQEAQAELVDGGLLPLYDSTDDRTTVGFLRYMRDDEKVLFVDMFLCGKMSHSYFAVGANHESPSQWVANPVRPGNSLRDLEIQQNDALLQNSVTVIRDDSDATLLELSFQVQPWGFDDPNFDPENAAPTTGAGKVFLKLPKQWM